MCPERSELTAYFDGELSPEESRGLDAHVSQCAACAALIQEWRSIAALVASFPPLEPSASALLRVDRAAAAFGNSQLRRMGLLLSGVAAAVLFVASILWYRGTEENPLPQPPAAGWEITAVSGQSQVADAGNIDREHAKLALWMTSGFPPAHP